tara:strand:+ start:227 stop:949 length:723 start_codon:yes stop_codon:yes gene_type:complete
MTTNKVRIDLKGPHPHVIDSVISFIDYDENGQIKRASVVEAPLGRGQDIETEDLEDRLEQLVYRSFNFSSKFCGIDELTGKSYPEGELRTYKIKNSSTQNSHHCAGDVIYHPNNKYMLKWLDLIFWHNYKILPNHNLKNIKLKVLRTSGDIEDGQIGEDEALIWMSKRNDYAVRVTLEGGIKEKFVTLSKILNYNPNINITVTLPNREIYSECPLWLLRKYDEWVSEIVPNNFELKFDSE